MSHDSPSKKTKALLILHLMLMIYSMTGICSKLAASEHFLSPMFCVYYTIIILLLGFYAIGWQQIIKHLPLTTAFANKSITIVWGIVWGYLFFQEPVTIKKVVGALFVIAGVVLFALGDKEKKDES